MIEFSRRSSYVKNPILELDADAEALMRRGRSVIKLNRGDPPLYFKTPKYIIDAYVDSLRKNQTGYSRASGTKDLVEAVIGRYRRMYGVRVQADGVIATAGVTEALSFLNHSLMEAGDRAILFRPYYPQYIPRLMSEGGKPIYMEQSMENGWEIDMDGTERKLRSLKRQGGTKRIKYMLVTNPCNPTGRTLSRRTLARLADLANEYDFLPVSDEIYDEIVYDGARFTSMSQVAKGIPHIVFNGSSKNFDSTGFRVGFMVIPGTDKLSEALKAKMADYALTRLSLNTPAEHAVAEGIRNVKEHRKAIRAMVRGIRKRVGAVVEALEENPYVDVVMPDSTFYVFPRLRISELDFKDVDEFVRAALFEEGVQLTRGSAFGAPSNFRVVALPEERVLRDAMRRIERLCRRHRKR